MNKSPKFTRITKLIYLIHSQVDNYITRPISCDGVPDSGVSDGSENIFSSDIDTTSLAALQSQTVKREILNKKSNLFRVDK